MTPDDTRARATVPNETAKPSSRDGARWNADIAHLVDIERRSADEIHRMRAHERLALKARVALAPGNASDPSAPMNGVTADVSRGGCRAIFPGPVRVGDVYRLRFDREKLALPLVFARCLRCRMLREDAFEAGFSFFTPVDFDERPPSSRRDLFA